MKKILSLLLITVLIIGNVSMIFAAESVFIPTSKIGDSRLNNFGSNPNTLYQNNQGTSGNNYLDYRNFYLTFAEEYILNSVQLSIVVNNGRNPNVRIYGSDSTFTDMNLLTSGSINNTGTLTLNVSNNSTEYQYYIISMQSNYLNSQNINIWSVDGNAIDGTRCFKFVGETAVRYTITTAVSPSNSGTVSGAGTYLENENVTLTATPSTGYVFSSWNDGSTINPRTITVTQNATYTATFSPVQTTYILSVSANPTGSGSVTGGGTYNSGTSVTITATPNTGYEFVNWNDGNTNNPRTVAVNSDITLVANFQQVPDDRIHISTSVNPNGAGYVTGGGYYEENEIIELEAVPNTGYQFVDWNDGNDDNPRSITVTDELTLIANFELINPPEPVDQDSMTLVMLLVSFLILVMLERGTVFNG